MFEQIIAGAVPVGWVWLAVFIISMIPMVELRGAIPFGMATTFWGESVLGAGTAFIFAFLGSTAVSAVILWIVALFRHKINKSKFFRKVNTYIDEFIADRLDNGKIVVTNTADPAQASKLKRRMTLRKMWYVAVLTALPIPMSGTWTAALLSGAIGLNFWQGFAAIAAGNAVCGAVVALFCTVFGEFINLILMIVVIITVLVAVNYLLKWIYLSVMRKKQAKAESGNSESNI